DPRRAHLRKGTRRRARRFFGRAPRELGLHLVARGRRRRRGAPQGLQLNRGFGRRHRGARSLAHAGEIVVERERLGRDLLARLGRRRVERRDVNLGFLRRLRRLGDRAARRRRRRFLGLFGLGGLRFRGELGGHADLGRLALVGVEIFFFFADDVAVVELEHVFGLELLELGVRRRDETRAALERDLGLRRAPGGRRRRDALLRLGLEDLNLGGL